MTTAFQRSAFQNNAFQIDQTPPDSGAGGFITGGTFSRGRWHSLKEAWRLQREARERALRLRRKKHRDRLERAARLAAEALREAEAVEVVDAGRLLALTNALEAATGAKKVADAVAHAATIEQAAQAFLNELDEEEEAIIAFLLM